MKRIIIPLLLSAAVTLGACASEAPASEPSVKPAAPLPSKPADNANPILTDIFCADPTAVEYDGRLYVYGTNDNEQYEKLKGKSKNTYQFIKSFVMLSTDDMANWTYHGEIDTDSISPWMVASWAPSIVSREESDGLTHFYMYYSNSGCGVGMLTSTSPVGPWKDPLGKDLINGKTEGLKGCKIPFDPGAVIDGDGTGYLAFGGGEDSARIVKLGADMISLDSEIAVIPTAYHNEASELNYIGGNYVYTYCNDWNTRTKWEYEGKSRFPICSMAYLVSKTPLESDSWEYKGAYFKNPGEQGLEYGNNHTHLHKYCGKYYLLYHAEFPLKALGGEGGYRSLCVNEAIVDEENSEIAYVLGTKTGVSQIKSLDPFLSNEAETMAVSSKIQYSPTEEYGNTTVSAKESGGFILVKKADFAGGAGKIKLTASGEGFIDIYADNTSDGFIGSVKVSSDGMKEFSARLNTKLSGEHDIYFVLSEGVEFDKWKFE